MATTIHPRGTPWLVASASLMAVVAGCGRATGPAAPAPRPAVPYTCRFTDGPVVIDGRLDDEAWRGAADVGPFTMPWLRAGDTGPARATRAMMLWDDGHLYIAADMEDGDLYGDVTEHDGPTWDNDVFEVFLKPAVDEPAYYEFQVSVRNTQFDCLIPRRGHVARFMKMHEFGIESAVRVRGTLDDWTDRDEGWSVEMRIPWSSLAHTGGRPRPGSEWRFALCRYDYDVSREGPDLSTCAPLPHRSFHMHEHYRPLVFEGPVADRTPAGRGAAADD